MVETTKIQEVTQTTTQTPMEITINNKFIDGLAGQLNKKKEFGLSFPKDYNVANALNGAYLMLQETVDRDKKCVLHSCTKQSIATCLMDMTVQALNPMKKQCYFVPYGGKLTLLRSYQGTMAVAKRCGAKNISSQVIYEGDEFGYHIENGRKTIDFHKQDFMNIDITKIKGAYCIVDMGDYQHIEIMNLAQIKAAWKKGYGYKENGGVHAEFTDQMAIKTVINRACKNIINSSDDAYLNEAFENTTENENVDSIQLDMEHDIKNNANTEIFDPNVIDVANAILEKNSEDKETSADEPCFA